MRLRRLWLQSYLNLEDVSIEFNNEQPSLYGSSNIRFFVGLNGSGKSNALEAIGLIFGHLARGQVPDLRFELEYALGDRVVLVTTELDERSAFRYADPLDVALLVRGIDEFEWTVKHCHEKWLAPSEILPARIVGYATGPTTGLSLVLNKSAERMSRERLGQQLAELRRETDDVEQLAQQEAISLEIIEDERKRFIDDPTTMFIDSTDALCAIIALLAFDVQALSPQVMELRRRLLERVELDDRYPLVSFSLQLSPTWEELLPPAFGASFKDLLHHATVGVPNDDGMLLVFDVLPELGSYLLADFGSPRNLFERLLGWQRHGVLYKARLVFKKRDTDGLLLDGDLSDGEFLFLGRYALLLMMREVNHILVLLDEPETHFNDHWKIELVKDISDVLNVPDTADRAPQESDVVIATHSDLTLTDAAPAQVYLFSWKRSIERGSKLVIESQAVSSFAANRSDIARNYFQTPDSVGSFARESIEEALRSEDPDLIRAQIENTGQGFSRFRLLDKLEKLERLD